MATEIPDQLKEIARQIGEGRELQESVSVRALLSWFGAERRGYWIVRAIRKALRKLKLRTEPDFEQAWIDGQVVILARQPKAKADRSNERSSPDVEDAGKAGESGAAVLVTRRTVEDGTSHIRIGMLAAANRAPLRTSPNAEVTEAVTLMLQHDFSQLPVMTTERDVKGMLSWKSLGSRLALGKKCSTVSECTEAAHEIPSDASLFEAIQQIVEHECVLVRDMTRRITGIVTTADLSLQFAQLGEPFLMLGQIENHVRNLIADKFQKAELAAARDPADANREVEDVADLTLGEYVKLLESPSRWVKLGIQIDRKTFTGDLRQVCRIRNDVMHFDPDGVGPGDLATLRRFARFLSDLQKKLA